VIPYEEDSKLPGVGYLVSSGWFLCWSLAGERVLPYILFASQRLVPETNEKRNTTFSNGCLGSHNDEERSEMRYVMRIAKPRESSRF
jgi:hypothetical protein